MAASEVEATAGRAAGRSAAAPGPCLPALGGERAQTTRLDRRGQGVELWRAGRHRRRCGRRLARSWRAARRSRHGREREQPGAGCPDPCHIGARRLVGGGQSAPVRPRDRPDPRALRRAAAVLHGRHLRARRAHARRHEAHDVAMGAARHAGREPAQRDDAARTGERGRRAAGRGAALHLGHDGQSRKA